MDGSSVTCSLQKRMTLICLRFLFSLHGIPVFPAEKLQCIRCTYRILRLLSLAFVNLYMVYRIYKTLHHMNMTYDTFPLINAGVSACIVDSIAIYNNKFHKFSRSVHSIIKKYEIQLSNTVFLKLFLFYTLSLAYVLICAIVFPFYASHLFDAANKNDTHPDFLHGPSIQPCTHITIFVMCSSNVVSHLMLYCFVCCLLYQMLNSIYVDLKAWGSAPYVHSDSVQGFITRFLEAAHMVKCTDKVFSFFGLVGLGCVFARACSCIHFYLNMKSPFTSSWFFIFMQCMFDFCSLTALSLFAAMVSEEARKLAPLVFHVSHKVSPKKTDFHMQCLNFSKIVMSSEVHLSAWKLFPFSRRVLPTVIGVTLSYVTVIIQMHHAATLKLEKIASNQTSDV